MDLVEMHLLKFEKDVIDQVWQKQLMKQNKEQEEDKMKVLSQEEERIEEKIMKQIIEKGLAQNYHGT